METNVAQTAFSQKYTLPCSIMCSHGILINWQESEFRLNTVQQVSGNLPQSIYYR